jgi:catechol 2,3-dioxygenase
MPLLPDATRPGPVRLQVASLERSVAFYERVLGLRVLQDARAPAAADVAADTPGTGADIALGTLGADRVLIRLHEMPGAHPAARPPRLGLYHFALLLPDRTALGRFAAHLARLEVRAGAGDHLVSEAFYLNDPDGLGIEVYADRPRESWRRAGGHLVMATDPVDVEDVVAAGGGVPWDGMPGRASIGHVHLHVGDLGQAQSFYADALGFEITTSSYPGALFLAAGDYHHHLGVNTWAAGAVAAGPGDAQLLEWTLELPDAESVRAAGRRLAAAGYAVETGGGSGVAADARVVTTRDPWGTTLALAAGGA